MIRAVLFDLDGTLVESAPGILKTFRWLFAKHGIFPDQPIDASVIGPPLRDTLKRLTGIADRDRIEDLAKDFRERYDATAVAETAPFDGYHETIDAVRGLGYELLVVTNKRIEAARAILNNLGRAERYTAVYSPDLYQPALPNKAAVIADAVKRHAIDTKLSVFVGDSLEDASAAKANGLPFIAALYGYGSADLGSDPQNRCISALKELPACLASAAVCSAE